MKVLLSVGHSILKNGNCTSADGRAYGGLLEYSYNKSIVERTARYLRKAGHEADILICPEFQFQKSTDEKNYKIPIENAGDYDLVAELHLNASNLHSIRGCEVLYISNVGKKYADNIVQQLGSVFKNRGAKYRSNLYMLKSTKAPSVIVESFYCDNSEDCALAEKTDVARLIAQGIAGKVIDEEKAEAEDTNQTIYRVQVGAYSIKKNAEAMAEKLKNAGFDAIVVS